MVERWEDDPMAPNLYNEAEQSRYFLSKRLGSIADKTIATTLQDVCLELARYETRQLELGQMPRLKLQ
jgi:uncharacterized phage-associated protein